MEKVAYLRILDLSQYFGQEDDSTAADLETELLPVSMIPLVSRGPGTHMIQI